MVRKTGWCVDGVVRERSGAIRCDPVRSGRHASSVVVKLLAFAER